MQINLKEIQENLRTPLLSYVVVLLAVICLLLGLGGLIVITRFLVGL
ncbi:MAG: hypothetical protein ACOYCA_03125 [Eggerthellaceae bacterium]